MPKGILQLVAKNIEDSILTDNPSVTLFKTMYRRHTNYSKYEHKLNFYNSLNFGINTNAILKRRGDLLHKLYLVIDLPEININLPILSRQEVQTLLNKYNISYTFTENPNEPISETELTSISNSIETKIIEINSDIIILNNMLSELSTNYNPANHQGTPVNTYYQNIITSLMQFEDDNIYYKYTLALFNDTTTPRTIRNSDVLQLLLYNNIRDFDNGVLYFINNDTSTNIDEIIKLITYVEYGKFNANIYSDNLTIFNTTLDKIYYKVQNPPANITPDTSDYKVLDSYKTFITFLIENRQNINNTYELEKFRLLLVNHMINNVEQNFELFKKIYTVLTNRFSVYNIKPIRSQRGVVTLDITLPFISMSLVESTIDFDDLISSYLSLDTSLTFTHYYGIYINTQYNLLLQNMLSLFQQSTYSDYFSNNLSDLWNNLVLDLIIDIPSSISDSSELQNVYLFNFIPIMVIDDIPKVIKEYLVDKVGEFDSFTVSMDDQLTTTKKTLHDTIKDDISLTIEELLTLINIVKANKRSSADILLLGSLRPEIMINDKIIMTYIYDNFKTTIDTVIASQSPSQDIIDDIYGILNSFYLDINDIPAYTTYKNNSYRAYPTYDNTNRIISNGKPVFDIAGSIWNIIQNEFKNLFNNTIHDIFLNKTYFTESLGNEISLYLDVIVYNTNSIITNTYKILDGIDITGINYYAIVSEHIYHSNTIIDDIINFIIGKQNIYNNYRTRYESYKKLLKIKDAPINKKTHYFEQTTEILNLITTLVQNNSIYGYNAIPSVDVDLNTMLTESITNISSELGIMNIINEYKTNFIDVITNGASYTVGTNLYSWYTEFNIASLIQNEKDGIIDTFNNLMVWINAFNLYRKITIIQNKYNGFIIETNIYNFLKDNFIKSTKYVKLIEHSTGSDLETTYNNINLIFQQEKINLENTLTEIDGNLPEPILITNITNSRVETPVSFAWIKELGHFIIDNVTLTIGDQIIDYHTGEWLHINRELTRTSETERGYNIMIGNISELTTYDTNGKSSYRLYIPLQFWFCKHVSVSLPMTALFHVDTMLNVKLKKLEDVAYWNNNGVFKKYPKLNCHLIGEYIYLEEKERNLIATQPHEQLIETIQFNGEELISFDKLFLNTDGSYKAIIKLYFNNPCKEIIWVMQLIDKINGSELNGEKKWYDYTYHSSLLNNDISLATKIKLKFNGSDREIYKDSEFYNYYTPHIYHTSSIGTGKFVYTLSLYPEALQPSGCANFSRLDDTNIFIRINDELIQEMRDNNKIFRITAYAVSYNILRTMSGMSGLAFY